MNDVITEFRDAIAKLKTLKAATQEELDKPIPELSRGTRVILSGDDARFIIEELATAYDASLSLAQHLLDLAETTERHLHNAAKCNEKA